MPTRTQDIPIVAVHNNLETFFHFLQRADDPDIFRKRCYRGDRGLFWLGDPKLLFVTAASTAAGQVCRRWGYPDTSILAPDEPTHQLCLDILHEPRLLEGILEYAGPGRAIRLVPYATTAEFFQLAEALRGRGLEVLLPESPRPVDLWVRDYADSKSGFRAIVADCLPAAEALPPGFVFRDPVRAAAAVEWFLERGQPCVVKADCGESGIGHIIFTPGQERPEPILQTLEHNPFLRDDLIVVEQYIASPDQLSPSPELFVPPAGAGEVRVTYMTQQLFSSFGRFSGVLISRSLEKEAWYPKLCEYGLKIGTALQEMGYVGPFDLDAVVDGRGHLYLLETNTRRTGGTFVHEFACHTFGEDYLQRVALLSRNAVPSGGILHLDGLLERLAGLLFPDLGPDRGVVIAVTSTLPAGEFGCILVAPDEAGLAELNDALTERLQIDRDPDGSSAGGNAFERLRRELERCRQVDPVMPSDLLLLPPALQDVLNQAFRDGRISAAGLAAGLSLELPDAHLLAGLLVEKGYLQAGPPDGDSAYAARFGGRTTRTRRGPLDRL